MLIFMYVNYVPEKIDHNPRQIRYLPFYSKNYYK